MIGTTFKLEYGERPQYLVIESVDQLDAELDRIAEEARDADLPALVSLYTSDDRSLSIGVGSDRSVAVWMDMGSRPRRSFGARGTVETNQPISFQYTNSSSEFGPEEVIQVGEARQAMREFFGTMGGRPTNLEWRG